MLLIASQLCQAADAIHCCNVGASLLTSGLPMPQKVTSSALWTTSAVARALHVGVSSVKRWTDEGALKSVKTLGGHRRYEPTAVQEFANGRGFDLEIPVARQRFVEEPLPVEALRTGLLCALEQGEPAEAREIIAASATHGLTRAEFLDRVVAPVLEMIGHAWRDGSWTVGAEHRASYIVGETLDRLRPEEIPEHAPVAVLACPPGDLHDLPLRMVRLVLEWSDWNVDYLGADVPFDSLAAAVDAKRPHLVLLTARGSEPFATNEFSSLSKGWLARGIRVGIGGWWARGGARRGDGLLRFRTLRGFERWLHSSDALRTR